MPPNPRFPGFPPGGNGHRPDMPPIQVVSPLNDYQVLALMSAVLMSGQPVPATGEESADVVLRNNQAEVATERALDLLKHASFRHGMGQIQTSVRTATAMGQEHIQKALAEQEERERNGAKILGADGEPAG